MNNKKIKHIKYRRNEQLLATKYLSYIFLLELLNLILTVFWSNLKL